MRPPLRSIILSISVCCILLGLPAGYNYAAAADSAAVVTNTHAPTDAEWKALQKDEDLDYAADKELKKPVVKPADTKPNAFIRFLQSLIVMLSGTLGVTLLWLIIFAIVGYVIYHIVIGEKSFLFGKKKTVLNTEEATETDEDLMITDWEERLRNAYAQGDLRLAIRYSYMWLLRLMQERELIEYRNDKTNNDYYHELSETSYRQPFRRLTREYEFSWYGGYPVSDAAYQEYMQLFNTIKTQLH